MAPDPPDVDDPLLDRLREALRGEYDVERRLGAGGMGYVYRGRDPGLDMPVAIKVLRPELATARAAERFLHETRALAAVVHPNVVTIHRALERHGLFLYVMELVGETLADQLRRGPLRPREAVRLGMDLLAGLERVHEAGIVHRDIKPANVFLQPHGPAKIGDFGIAHVSRLSGDRLTETGGVAPGTPVYMAPEQFRLGEASPASDLYSIAMVICEAMTARRWKTGTDPARGDWRGVPRRVRPVLRRALEIDPAARWPDARTFRHALAATLRQRTPVTVAVVAAVVAVATGIAWWVYVRTHDHERESDVAVLPFDVVGGDARVGEQLAISVELNLSTAWGDSGFGVTPHTHTRPYAREVGTDPLRADAWDRLHTRRVLRGRVEIRGDTMVVTSELVVPDRSTLAPGQQRGPVTEMTAVGYRLAEAVTRLLAPTRASRFVGYRPGGEGIATAAFVDGAYAFEQDNWDAAEAAYREAIAADSAYGDAWWGLYKVQSWRRARHEVDLAHVYGQFGSQLSELDRLIIEAELAPTILGRIRWYSQAIDRVPYDAYPRLMLGNELFHRGALAGMGFDSAITVLNGAVQANPYLAATYSMLAWAHIRRGDSARAREALDQYRARVRDPDAGFSLVSVLELARLARFDVAEFGRQLNATARTRDGPGLLAERVRLGLAFGVPDAQDMIGHGLEDLGDDGLRLIGLTAQAPAQLSKGRVAEALAHLDEAARVSGDSEFAFQAAQWAVVLPALGVPGVAPDARTAARARLSAWASAGARVTRARWTLLLDAIAVDTTLVEGRLADLAESPEAPALVDLGTALVLAMRGDTTGALRLADSLTNHVVAAQVADPLQRAVLYLSRGHWLAGRHADRADAAWRWYENADFVGWPQGHLQAAELDWALETYARYLRASLAHAARDADRVCGLAPEAIVRWANADPSYAPLLDSLAWWTRACTDR